MKEWHGVDFDATLATYTEWDDGKLGEPVFAMVNLVKQWIANGEDVRVMTARAASIEPERERFISEIKQWCLKHIGTELEVTAEKDMHMIDLYDDRAKEVMPNEGILVTEIYEKLIDHLAKKDS